MEVVLHSAGQVQLVTRTKHRFLLTEHISIRWKILICILSDYCPENILRGKFRVRFVVWEKLAIVGIEYFLWDQALTEIIADAISSRNEKHRLRRYVYSRSQCWQN